MTIEFSPNLGKQRKRFRPLSKLLQPYSVDLTLRRQESVKSHIANGSANIFA